jgi:four helix bundle protein
MASFKSFEEIEAWQISRELTREVYACTNRRNFSRDFGLCDQIRRAAVSVMSNIAEGFERGGNAEFIQFLAIAKGSTGEVESQLYVALDQTYITSDEFQSLKKRISSLKKMLAGFMNYLKRSTLRGLKFKKS